LLTSLALIPVSWPTLPLAMLALMAPGTFKTFQELVELSHMKGMIWMLYIELLLMQLPLLILKFLNTSVWEIDKDLALASFVLVIVASSFYNFISCQGNNDILASVVITGLSDIYTGALLILHVIGDASSEQYALPTRYVMICVITIQSFVILYCVIAVCGGSTRTVKRTDGERQPL
jgi:hypothetical protein